MNGILINLVLFKAGWLACVMLAAANRPALATLAVAAVVVIHLLRVAVPVKEALILLAAALLGLAWESFLLSTGLLQYPESSQSGAWAPHWIVAMWVLFATTINHGLAWVKRNWMLCAGMGLIGGPLAFWAGSRMGAVSFSDPVIALLAVGAGWSLLLPMLALIADTITDSAFLEPSSGNGDRHSDDRSWEKGRGQTV